jgi:UDP-N-acetylglucosamine 2-epimerase
MKKTIVTVTGIRPDFIRMSEIFKCLDNEESFPSNKKA